MKKENAYDFRKKLLTVHESNVRDHTKAVPEDALLLKDGLIIEIGANADEVIQTAAADFADFFAVSMDLKATVSQTGEYAGANVVRVALADDKVEMGEAAGYKGFRIDVDTGISVYGYDSRGAAQGLFYLEDLMCMDHAPFVRKGTVCKKPIFAPQMIHSGYGIEEWPDEYMMRVAHEGRDAILIFASDVNQTRVGYLDFNDLIARANRCGLDVYIYSFIRSDAHPDEEGAQAYYDRTYGKLFRECPGIAGVTLVGEAVEFSSKDPHVSRFRSFERSTDDLPDGLQKPGWYPCEEVPRWVELVKRAVRKEKADADVVLWTYNWGFQPEEARLRLIEGLPTDITLQATFEMFDTRELEHSTFHCADYSISFVGPGKYFASEAEAAKRRGIRLYAMMMSAGVTWDFGTIPYEPMPYQWMKRFAALRKANKDWGLCGGMDTHHHGLYPSIITKFSKHAFLEPLESMEEILERILVGEYGKENLPKVKEGFRLWSEAMEYFIPSEEDLCSNRAGPITPLCLFHKTAAPVATDENILWGRTVTEFAGYDDPSMLSSRPRESVLNLRIHDELASQEKCLELLLQGVAVFESIPKKNEKLLEMLNLGKYIVCCMRTFIHVKRWYLLKCRFHAEFTKEGLWDIIAQMEQLLEAEGENVKAAIPLVERDSRLGWEPSMGYRSEPMRLDWKLRQLAYVRDKELARFKRALEMY